MVTAVLCLVALCIGILIGLLLKGKDEFESEPPDYSDRAQWEAYGRRLSRELEMDVEGQGMGQEN